MPSSASSSLKLELMATGENSTTWGTKANANFQMLEGAAAGFVQVAIADSASATTVTVTDYTLGSFHNVVFEMTGALTAARTLEVPALERYYTFVNATTGGYAVTVKVNGQTGVSVPAGGAVIAYNNGTDVKSIATFSAYGLTLIDDANASTARTTLGLGTIATQNSSAVTITGGTITGITDLAVADGGTGASTAAGARTNLGVVIGTDVQAYDAGLASIAGLATVANQMLYLTGADTYATTSLTAFGRTLLDDADAAAARTTLGLGTAATTDATAYATAAQGAKADTAVQPNTSPTLTTLTATTVNAALNGTLGATTPAAATVTTLTASGNVNVDSGTLFVDAANNRVGVGTTSPGRKLVVSAAGIDARINLHNSDNAKASATTLLEFSGSDGRAGFVGYSSGDMYLAQDTAGKNLHLRTNGVSRVVIASDGTTSIGAAPGSESLRVVPVSGAVNFPQMQGAATGGSPTISAQGSDANVPLVMAAKGASYVALEGNGQTFVTGSVGGATKACIIRNTTVAPSSNHADGGYLYVEAGALKWRGSSGTVTTLGPA